MARRVPYQLLFLGTSSGGGPTPSRGHTSTLLRLPSQESWLVDCGEGTTRSLRQFKHKPFSKVEVDDVRRVFITHMHMDHTMGLMSLMSRLLRYPNHLPDIPQGESVLDIYGPPGLRTFVRTNLYMARATPARHYAVHELLLPEEQPMRAVSCEPHPNEVLGADIQSSADGTFPVVFEDEEMTVHAAPIQHRVPCLGYVFQQNQDERAKVAILGDTSDPSPIIPYAMDADILVHESTLSWMPKPLIFNEFGSLAKIGTEEEVEGLDIAAEMAIEKGHSSAQMAGAFAKTVRAKRLYMNHISARIPGPNHRKSLTNANNRAFNPAFIDYHQVMREEIVRQALEAGGPEVQHATVAHDGLVVEVECERSLAWQDRHDNDFVSQTPFRRGPRPPPSTTSSA